VPLILEVGRRHRRTRALMLFITSVLVLGILLHLFPVWWMISTSLKPSEEVFRDPGRLWPKHPSLASYKLVFQAGSGDRIFKYPMRVYIVNSLLIACSTVALQIPITMLLAYAVCKLHRGWAQRVLFYFAIGTLMIPGEITTIPRFLLLSHFPWPTRNIPHIPFTDTPMPSFSFIGSYLGVILPACFNAFNFLLFKGFFDTLPNELFESARIDGAGEWRIVWSLIVPLAYPVLVVTTYFSFLAAWNSFLTPYIILMSQQQKWPLCVILYKLSQFLTGWNVPETAAANPQQLEMLRQGIGFNALMALSIIETLPLFVLFIIFREHIMKGVRLQGLK